MAAVQDYALAIKCCDDAFSLEPSNLKIVLRRCRASSLNGDFAEADAACKALLESDASEAVREEAQEIAAANSKREAAAKRKQKAQFSNFFDR